jgi:predicted RecB family nuclease
MIVSTQLFEAHLECPTKCWLLSRAEPAPGNIYAEWVRVQKATYCDEGIKRLLAGVAESDLATGLSIEKNLVGNWRLVVDLRLRTAKLESHLRAAERTSPEARGRPAQLVPYRFQFANKLTKNDKLSLAFDAFVLSEVVGSEVSFGRITHGDGHVTRKVKLSPLASEVQERVQSIAALVAQDSPPDLVLNAHCRECEFQARCHRLAADRDELSLLSGMSETERKKLHDKGIFTVTQLSYTFRPRRRRRQSHGKQEKFHHSLRALAIRENKIHAADLLDPRLNGTLVYLDVEGLPDCDFYYLIGILVRTADGPVQHGFWADDEVGEKRIWNEFLDTLSTIRDPQLIHFGSYETVFLKRMRERHGAPPKGSAVEKAIEHPVNLLSLIFARIYFPTFTNGVKEIAGYLGFRWSGPVASGLEAIVWRQRWEISRDPKQRKALLDYNREDCEALEAVADKLIEIHHASPLDGQPSQNDVVRTSKLTRQGPFVFKRNEFVFPEMESINKAAYWDYQRERVYVKSRHKLSCKRKRYVASRSALSPNATVEYARPSFCPTCKSKLIYRHGKRRKTVVDLRFMRHGVKRWVTRHVAQRYRCLSCLRFPEHGQQIQNLDGASASAYL